MILCRHIISLLFGACAGGVLTYTITRSMPLMQLPHMRMHLLRLFHSWKSDSQKSHSCYKLTLKHSSAAMPRSGKQKDLQPEEVHHALKYGAPSTEHLRFFKDFVVSCDTRLRNPRWVMEHITRKQTRGVGNRQAPARARPSPCMYRRYTGQAPGVSVHMPKL